LGVAITLFGTGNSDYRERDNTVDLLLKAASEINNFYRKRLKKLGQGKEVYCSEPSLSVSVPCSNVLLKVS
jgi:hypothetical protein